MKEKTLSVSAIKEGTVIDHIGAGQALKIIRILKLQVDEHPITLGLNLKSKSMGLKDLIKIENVFLTEGQASQIAVFSPTATVNVIEHYKVAKKFRVELPPAIAGLLLCLNPRCITRHESIPTLFTVQENNSRVLLRCRFCEKVFPRDELNEKV